MNFNGSTGTGFQFNDAFPTPIVPGTVSAVENQYNLVGCCRTVSNALFENQSELVKLRYRLSSATTATFTYLGSQTRTDQAANTGDITPSTFSLSPSQSAGYNGALPNNSAVDVAFLRTPEYELNNEPILQGDIRSTIGNDTVLARYYSAGIHRLLFQGTGPKTPTWEYLKLYGYDTGTKTTYNGQVVPIAYFDWFNQAENDKLQGYSFEWDHPFAANNLLTLAYDQTHSTTTSYSVFTTGGPSAGKPFDASSLGVGQSITLPTGSAQDFGTGLIRSLWHPNPKLAITFSNYINTYKSTVPVACKPVAPAKSCTFDGTGYVFGTTTKTHYDPRIALEIRPNSQLAVRFSAGSAIAPPYLALLSTLPSKISYNGANGIATKTQNAGTLSPETAFGYDLGGDYRFRDGVTFVTGDIYLENLYNHFINTTYNSGLTCPAIDPVTGAATGCAPSTPLFYTSNVNLTNTRLEGIELAIRRVPLSGIGYTVQGALQKGYPYNLPQCFYSSTFKNGQQVCSALNTNLAVVPNQNFGGGGISGNGLGVNGLSNQNLPYAQGYGELNWRAVSGWYANVGVTYYGKNNSLNRPPFTILSASLRAPLSNGLTFQVSGDNLTNQYPGLWPVFGGGVPLSLQGPLADSKGNPLPAFAATQANVLGPSTVRFVLTKSFGQGANPTP
jgi:hypothetical protein